MMVGYIKNKNTWVTKRSPVIITSWEINNETVYSEKSNFTITESKNISNGDVFIFEDYMGIIDEIIPMEDYGATEIRTKPITEIFDRNIILPSQTILDLISTAGEGIEGFIKNRIEAEFKNIGDAFFAMPYITVTAKSNTVSNILPDDEDGIYSIKSFIGKARRLYNVKLTITSGITSLDISIERDSTDSRIIDLTRPDIKIISENYSNETVSRVDVFCTEDDSTTSYFLLADGRITTTMPGSNAEYSIDLAAPLYKVSDIAADTLNVLTGLETHKCGKIILDGTESWAIADSNADYLRFTLVLSGAGGSDGTINCLCTHFNGINYAAVEALTIEGAATHNNSGSPKINITALASRFADVAAFKAWMAGQYAIGLPVTIIYALETQTTTNIGTKTIPAYSPKSSIAATAGTLDIDYTDINDNTVSVTGDQVELIDVKNGTNLVACTITGESRQNIIYEGNNLYDGVMEYGGYSPATGNKLLTSIPPKIGCKNKIKVSPLTKYSIKNFTTPSGMALYFYDANYGYVEYGGSFTESKTFITPLNVYYIAFDGPVNSVELPEPIINQIQSGDQIMVAAGEMPTAWEPFYADWPVRISHVDDPKITVESSAARAAGKYQSISTDATSKIEESAEDEFASNVYSHVIIFNKSGGIDGLGLYDNVKIKTKFGVILESYVSAIHKSSNTNAITYTTGELRRSLKSKLNR